MVKVTSDMKLNKYGKREKQNKYVVYESRLGIINGKAHPPRWAFGIMCVLNYFWGTTWAYMYIISITFLSKANIPKKEESALTVFRSDQALLFFVIIFDLFACFIYFRVYLGNFQQTTNSFRIFLFVFNYWIYFIAVEYF